MKSTGELNKAQQGYQLTTNVVKTDGMWCGFTFRGLLNRIGCKPFGETIENVG